MNEGAQSELQFPILSALHRLHGGCYLREMLADLHPVGRGQHKNRQVPSGEILLIAQVLVGGDKHIELSFRRRSRSPFSSVAQPISKAVATWCGANAGRNGTGVP